MNSKEIKNKLIERDGLRCAITGEEVSRPEDLSIEHIKPLNAGGTDDLDNLVLIRHDINASLADDDRRRTKMLLDELKTRQEEISKREKEAFERERAYRRQLERQQKELEEAQARLRIEQSTWEQELQAELESQQKRFREQQNEYQLKMQHNEDVITKKMLALEDERRNLKQELQAREELLQLSQKELEQEKKRYTEESQKKIEKNSEEYVNEALSALDESAKKYHSISRNWSLTGLAALISGVSAAGYFALVGLGLGPTSQDTDWARVIFFGFKGVILVALFVAIAKYCFSYSQSFMHESLKNSERKHAINFGKLYLQSYGVSAEWKHVKEAFEHWNIAPSSAFSKDDSDKFDPKIVEKATQLIDAVGKLKPFREQEKVTAKKE